MRRLKPYMPYQRSLTKHSKRKRFCFRTHYPHPPQRSLCSYQLHFWGQKAIFPPFFFLCLNFSKKVKQLRRILRECSSTLSSSSLSPNSYVCVCHVFLTPSTYTPSHGGCILHILDVFLGVFSGEKKHIKKNAQYSHYDPLPNLSSDIFPSFFDA